MPRTRVDERPAGAPLLASAPTNQRAYGRSSPALAKLPLRILRWEEQKPDRQTAAATSANGRRHVRRRRIRS